jgi:hypothetical protein
MIKSADFIGCFDDSGVRDLNGFNDYMTPINPETCIQHCKSQNYSYAALQDS